VTQAALGVPLSQVRYFVSVEAPPETFANERGQSITVAAAYLSYASLGLGRCAVTPPVASQARKALLGELFGLPRAHAGHEGVLDPSFSDEGWVLDLRKPARARLLAERYFPATAYCRAQSVLAGANENFVGYPKDTNLHGFTMHVRGRYKVNGSEQPFVLETDLPYGALSELPKGGEPGDRASLSMTHDLRAALRDIDLQRDEPEAASKQLLRALADRAHVVFRRERAR
jgi:hypothetical protein